MPLQQIFLNHASAVYVHKLSHKQCMPLYGCFNARAHAYFAWAFSFAFPVLVIVIYGVSVASSRRRAAKGSACAPLEPVAISVPCTVGDESNQPSSPTPATHKQKEPDVYSAVEHHARNVKAVLQMFIGVIAVCVVGTVALLLQGVLLAVLFATRLMLAERNEDDDDRPNIWWINERRDRKRPKR